MKIDVKDITLQNDRLWKQIKLTNDQGMTVSFLNFGGIITEIIVPDKVGNKENVVLAYKDFEQYLTNPGYLGALIGRVAGRIEGATFELDGETYNVETNEGRNNLHGGENGFHNRLWKVDTYQQKETVCAKLTCTSQDGEGGFPGNIEVEVTYTLNNENQFIIEYAYRTDQNTPVTLTNHTYFNLGGNAKYMLHSHELMINSGKFIELDEQLIPTGKLLEVDGTSFDFRGFCKLKSGFHRRYQQNKVANGGYDHYFIFDNDKRGIVAVKDALSGRMLSVETDQPGVVVYTSNNLPEGLKLKEGKTSKYLGLCLETQGSPASLHHKELPSIICKEGEVIRKRTTFRFGLMND